jgi:6-phosphogluconolactonase
MDFIAMKEADRIRPECIIANDDKSFVNIAAARIADELRRAINARGSCSIMLCGGETPRMIYETLAGAELTRTVEWSKVTIFFGDERCVSPDHPASNFRMARESLLERLQASPLSIERMRAEERDARGAADDYASKLPPSVDIVLLGVGEDGHTASLFPGSAALREETRLVVPVFGPKPPHERLTITPPVIRNAAVTIVLASGINKAEIIRRALEGPFDPVAIPVQLALDGVWILDRDAASSLSLV